MIEYQYMKKIIFFDTETTGNEPKKDFLCQLAFKTKDETFCEFFKPLIPIPPEASAKLILQIRWYLTSQSLNKVTIMKL